MRLIRPEFSACKIMLLCISLAISGCTNIFFQPLRQHLASPDQYKIDYEDIYFKGSTDLNLHGWWFPGLFSATQPLRGTVIFLHGNGENISTHAGLVYWLTKYQYDVFIFDYRGYGKSEGDVQLEGILDDINSARKYVESRKHKNSKLFVIGHSLGASLGIVNLATNSDKVDGMILVSPFSDYRKITREVMSNSWLTWAFQWPVSMAMSTEYNPIDFVNGLPDVPKVFIYSNNDRMINSEHIKALYKKASEPKFIEAVNGYHNSIFAQKESQQIIINYLQQWSR